MGYVVRPLTYNLSYQGDTRDQEDPSRLFIVAPLVLGYLILDDLSPARYALTRLPHSLANHPLSQALFSLLSVTWYRRHPSVYQRSQELADVVSAPTFFSQPLATFVRTLNEKFIYEFRERTFALIARAYTSVPLPLLQTYLGSLPVNQILSAAQQKGWSYDAANQVLNPLRPHLRGPGDCNFLLSWMGNEAQQDFAPVVPSQASTLSSFDVVADGTADLESIL
ncbi:hypothetical protein JB92DRAFT_2715048 [Gautieria morchelliformis]|nr:hypothetical protein JB92DRAFT_2715048 [Gautieria morchelliformis]